VIDLIRRLALPIAITSLAVNTVMLVASCVLWWLAIVYGWVDSVAFVSHVSLLALVFAAVTGVAAALAGILALVPTDNT
jgi:ABC-type polysaccharide/polyol phosphate export permease